MRLPSRSARVIGVRGDESRTVSVSHRCAVRKQRVLVGQVRVGVNRDGRHLELTAQRSLIERFDVLQLVHVREAFGVDLARRRARRT